MRGAGFPATGMRGAVHRGSVPSPSLPLSGFPELENSRETVMGSIRKERQLVATPAFMKTERFCLRQGVRFTQGLLSLFWRAIRKYRHTDAGQLAERAIS
jgi:hypothetical protein